MKKFSKIFQEHIASHSMVEDSNQLSLAKALDKIQLNTRSWGALKALSKLFSIHRNDSKKNGIYIWGEVGVGKTMVLNLFFDSLQTQYKLRKHFHAFMIETHETLHNLRELKKSDAIKSYASSIAKLYDIIILDELQINNIADAMIVGRLFSELAKRNVRIIFSSNRAPSALFKDGLQRERFLPFIHFVESTFDLVSLDSATDYRLRNFTINDAYFYPLNADSSDKIDSIIKSLIEDHSLEERNLNIASNHDLLIHKAYGHLASFSFNELCATNLGALDYLALCNAFSIIIIKNIPKLDNEMHNEALRFITIIDCLYEHNVKVICSAECSIDDLYQEGKNSFEFKRTISRLKEMQTREYLDRSDKISFRNIETE